MRLARRGARSTIIVATIAALVAAAAAAQIQAPGYGLEWLVEESSLVLLAEVTETIPSRDFETGAIQTLVVARSRRALSPLFPETVRFVLPGGAVEGLAVARSDVPALFVGDWVLLFLEASEEGSYPYRPVAATSGVFKVSVDDGVPISVEVGPEGRYWRFEELWQRIRDLAGS